MDVLSLIYWRILAKISTKSELIKVVQFNNIPVNTYMLKIIVDFIQYNIQIRQRFEFPLKFDINPGSSIQVSNLIKSG